MSGYVNDVCENMLRMSMNDVAILNINGADYHCIISRINKSEAINLLKNVDLIDRSRIL